MVIQSVKLLPILCLTFVLCLSVGGAEKEPAKNSGAAKDASSPWVSLFDGKSLNAGKRMRIHSHVAWKRCHRGQWRPQPSVLCGRCQ